MGVTTISGGALSGGGGFRLTGAAPVSDILHGDDISLGWFVAGYRPSVQSYTPSLAPGVSRDASTRTVLLASLFYFDGYLPVISEWLWNLEARVNKAIVEKNDEDAKFAARVYEHAKRCIVAILPDGVQFVRVQSPGQAVFQLNGSEARI